MKFMVIVKATPETEAGAMPDQAMLAAMTGYHEELAAAGALIDATGLKPTASGWRIRYAGDTRTVIDGPFTEAKELIAGYTIIDVPSREAALEWTRRYPNPVGPWREAEIEVRQLFSPDDLGESATMERWRGLELVSQK